MKTLKQLAEDHANMRCPEQGPEFIVWCMCKDDFLTGYNARKRQEEEEHKQAEAKMEAAIDRMKDRVQAWWLRNEK
jgi:hypothetical protein